MSTQESVTADQQSQKKKTFQECEKCKAEGKPGQLISFEKAGMRGDGSIIWKLTNPDGTEHIIHPKKDSSTYRRSVWAVRGLRSGSEAKVNQWLEEQKNNRNGYFDILGEGYFKPDDPETRMFDLLWKEKLE